MAKHILEENFLMGRISAVICEFNPFHKGHKARLDLRLILDDLTVFAARVSAGLGYGF